MSEDGCGVEHAGRNTTRREALRRFMSVGVGATVLAGFSELLTAPFARADNMSYVRVPVSDVLAALPADASPELIAAVQSTCCIHYTVAEFRCGSGSCGTGYCCYHIVSSDCGIDEYQCLAYGCGHGNFSTGC